MFVWRKKLVQVVKMEAGYQSAGAREADFQKLAQNTGTNIQKILQNGKAHYLWLGHLDPTKQWLFSVSLKVIQLSSSWCQSFSLIRNDT